MAPYAIEQIRDEASRASEERLLRKRRLQVRLCSAAMTMGRRLADLA